MDRDLMEIVQGLHAGTVIPYLGAGLLPEAGSSFPSTLQDMAEILSGQVTVPHRIRRNLTGAAQYIENFKHRKTLVHLMDAAFSGPVAIYPVQRRLAEMRLPLIVHLWYDDSMAQALSDAKASWGRIQGLSQSEHFGQWTGFWTGKGQAATETEAGDWETVLYEPWGARSPASNYLVSDSDFVEVLTEIDIQTPIPQIIQDIRKDRNFLFLGCHFDDQLQRTFARQIMKRSSGRHWVLADWPMTRNERRFVEEQNIHVLQLPAGSLFAEISAETVLAG